MNPQINTDEHRFLTHDLAGYLCLSLGHKLLKQNKQAVMIKYFPDAERGEISVYDRCKTAYPIAGREQGFCAKREPKKETFGRGVKGFGDREIEKTRLSEKDRGQHQHDYGIRACGEPNAAPEPLLERNLWRQSKQ